MLKLAVVGGGPSAFFLAFRLLRLLPQTDFRIHIYDRLWAPHGLVRYGVAPDHPEVKNCTHKFDEVASDPRVRFFGNVNVAATPQPFPSAATPHAFPLPLSELYPHYSHVVFATGAPLPKLHPLLPRSSLCIPALDIVHWYTKHPLAPAAAPIPPGTKHISIIGHGNVSLDIARLLLTPPSVLATLDLPFPVADSFIETWTSLRHISIIGRRGPREVRFTAKELREMMHLPDARMRPIRAEIIRQATTGELTRQQSRILRLLGEGSIGTPKHKAAGWAGKTFSIDFWRAPAGYTVLPSGRDHNSRAILELERTRLDGDHVIGAGTSKRLPTDFIVTSLGYQADPELFGDADGLPTLSSRILNPASGHTLPNIYAVGWASHASNARGVLSLSLLDANATADSIVADWSGRRIEDVRGDVVDVAKGTATPLLSLDPPPPIVAALRARRVLEYAPWMRVDAEERRRGESVGKERERMGWGDVRRFLGWEGRADTSKD